MKQGSGPPHFQYCNDMHILDMQSMKCKKVHDNLSNGEGPKRISERNCKFICISQSMVFIIGVFWDESTQKFANNTRLMMNMHNAKQCMEPSAIWMKIANVYPRANHAAILQPLSKTLWVIGGTTTPWK